MLPVAGSVRTIRIGLRGLEIAVVKALGGGEKIDRLLQSLWIRHLEILVQMDHVAVQAGDREMAHPWQPEDPVFGRIKMFADQPQGRFGLREIARRFEVRQQEQGPQRGSEVGRIVHVLRAFPRLFLVESPPERIILFGKDGSYGLLSEFRDLCFHTSVLYFLLSPRLDSRAGRPFLQEGQASLPCQIRRRRLVGLHAVGFKEPVTGAAVLVEVRRASGAPQRRLQGFDIRL
jgi:hypothetical protein